MMAKMNIHKIHGSTPIRAERQNDVKTTADDIGQPIEAMGEDRIEFSSRASEVTNLVGQIKQMPDVRQPKVAALREQLASGNLKHSGEDIAGAIVNDERS